MVVGGAMINTLLGSSQLWERADASFSSGAALGTARFPHGDASARRQHPRLAATAALGRLSAELWTPKEQSFVGVTDAGVARLPHGDAPP
jgi:hypothetical protein